MVAVGFLLVWAGYSVGLWGWCLLRDYDVTLGQLMSPFHPYNGKWPPAPIGDDVIWPGGRTPASSGSGGQGQAATTPGGITVNPPGGGVQIPIGGFPITIPLSQQNGNGTQVT